MGNEISSNKLPEKFGSITGKDGKFRPGYYVSKDKVIYQGSELELLPNESNFEKLKYGYAKTNMNVFYKGKIVQGANPATFDTIKRPDVKEPTLKELNSVLGMDYLGNTKRYYHKGEMCKNV